MPYIGPEFRKILNEPLDEFIEMLDRYQCMGQAGLVNYVIARMVSELIRKRGCSYAVLNEFIGALECCKLEFYRRLAAPYEDKKIQQNGDVF